MGDNVACVEEIKESEENLFPVIFLEGSPLCNDVIAKKGGFPGDEPPPEEEEP